MAQFINPALQARKIIQFIGGLISHTDGSPVSHLPNRLNEVIGTRSREETASLVNTLYEKGLIEAEIVEPIAPELGRHPTFSQVNLTLAGWEQYERHRVFAGDYGFMAFQYDCREIEMVVRHLQKVFADKGEYKLRWLRKDAKPGVMDSAMRKMIRGALFLIADLTHDNHGAYWEAGYAEGLGKTVIYTCEEKKFRSRKTHFNTEHCLTVLWSADKMDEFASELIELLDRSVDALKHAIEYDEYQDVIADHHRKMAKEG